MRGSKPSRFCIIGLGSNLGAREAHLRFALKRLRSLPQTRFLKASPWVETSPIGRRAGGSFLNGVALVQTALPPLGLLVELKKIEYARGRRPGPRWGPRTLDLDILTLGRLKVKSPLLSIPHPEIPRRPFLAPLMEAVVQ